MTKLKEISELVRIVEQKKRMGDYQTLAQALGTTVDAARMRYYRKDPQAIEVLYQIIEQREKFAQDFLNKQ